MADPYDLSPEVRAALKKVNDLLKKWAEEDWASEDPNAPTVITYERAVELNRRSKELGDALRELQDANITNQG